MSEKTQKISKTNRRKISATAQQRELTAELREQQSFGERLIKLSEYSISQPLTTYQKEVLLPQAERLKFLGLELISTLQSGVCLKASQVVGATRFVFQRKEVLVQVEPKIGNVNFFRLLDYTMHLGRIGNQITKLGTQSSTPVGLLLEFFADQTLEFLNRRAFRGYSFAQTSGFEPIKGRPLVNEYIRKSLPRAQPFVLPCRYLNFSADTLENRIIAYAVRLATNAAALLPNSNRVPLLKKLRACNKLLAGVSVSRITVKEIRNIRYNRINEDFRPIHKICELIIGNFSLSLQSGERISFLSLSVDMAQLFESYVSVLFQNAFANAFIGNKALLRFSLNSFDKEIVLDGLLKQSNYKAVVECKYKIIESSEDKDVGKDLNSFSVQGGMIRGADVYQTIAYASHEKIRASIGIIIYPIAGQHLPPLQITHPIQSLGWFSSSENGVLIYLLGVNLAAGFNETVEGLKMTIKKAIP